MTAPDWLKLRDGSLKTGLSQHTLFVILGGQPRYRLDVRPIGGGFACNVTRTVNGHRYDSDAKSNDEATAMASGLEKLREQLGW